MRSLLRIFKIVVIAEFIYVIVINLGLNLTHTQPFINQLQPEKFNIHWHRAWSIVPMTIHASGVSANGQSRGQQWQFDSPVVSGSLQLIPLLNRILAIDQFTARDANYRQRPRPRVDRDQTSIREYFPEIENRELETEVPIVTPYKDGEGWIIQANQIKLLGSHRIWIAQMQSQIEGKLSADLNYKTRGGPFSLKNGHADVKIASLLINNDHTVSNSGEIIGDFSFLPFVPSKNRGLKLLAFLQTNFEFNLDAEDLSFLDIYLNNFRGMTMNGSGQLEGHTVYEYGSFRPGTDVGVSANTLALNLLKFEIIGDGTVKLTVDEEQDDMMTVAIEFDQLAAYEEQENQALFDGRDLYVTGETTSAFPLNKATAIDAAAIKISIPEVAIPDISIYQSFIPDKLRINLLNGVGKLNAELELNEQKFNASIKLASAKTEMVFGDFQFETGLDFQITLGVEDLNSPRVNITGTSLQLKESSLIANNDDQSEAFSSSIKINKGVLNINTLDSPGPIKFWSGLLKRQNVKSLLETADINLGISGELSSLNWINPLLDNPYGFVVNGSGFLAAEVELDDGLLTKNTYIEVIPKKFSVTFLDYLVSGDGNIMLGIDKGGDTPDLNVSVTITGGEFRRGSEKESFVDINRMELIANAQKVSFDGPGGEMELQINIPSATVTDMAVYNSYLPTHSPLSLLAGQADLSAIVNIKPSAASGKITLKSTGMKAQIDTQQIFADLLAEINISDGKPALMIFDIAGSEVTVDNVKILGDDATYNTGESSDNSLWNAVIKLQNARVNWKEPLELEISSTLNMKDTRPLVAMMANKRGKLGWREKLLSVENVKGQGELLIKNNRIIIPEVLVNGGEISIGAKGTIESERRDGIVYARYKNLEGVLKISDGKRNFDILRAKQKFEQYVPGQEQH